MQENAPDESEESVEDEDEEDPTLTPPELPDTSYEDSEDDPQGKEQYSRL